jgi:ParB-like chromosome segregation protein Spo0J
MLNTTIRINQEYAKLVPKLSAEKNESLKQSIKQNGLWAPIAVNQDGVILYGRHRYKISQELGIEPRFEIKDFHDKAQEQMFVIDSNLKRRQPNDYQSIKVALKSKPILEQIAKRNQKAGVKIDTSAKYLTQVGRVNELIAMLAGVSSETVRKVEDIERAAGQDPKLLSSSIIGALEKGDISINSAYQTLKEARQGRYGLTYRIKKDKEKYDRILSGEKPPDYKKLTEKLLGEYDKQRQKINEDADIIESQKQEIERLKQLQQKSPIQEQQTTAGATTTKEQEAAKAPPAAMVTPTAEAKVAEVIPITTNKTN